MAGYVSIVEKAGEKKLSIDGKEYTLGEVRNLVNEIDRVVRMIETEKKGFTYELTEDGEYIKIPTLGDKAKELETRLQYMGIPKKK